MNLEASLPAAALTTWPGLEFPYKVFMPLCVHHPVAKFHISNQVFSLGSNSVQAERLCVCMLNSVTSLGELKMCNFVDNFM